MSGAERVIAIVPARAGSKGIARKNLAELGGRPLVAWAVLVAARTPAIDRVVVSTDDPEVAAVAHDLGAEVAARPAALAGDTAGVFDVVLDLRRHLRAVGETARVAVVLEPTAPFRSVAMLEACIAPVAAGKADSLATFRPCRTHPQRAWRLEGGVPAPFVEGGSAWGRRQELPPAWEISGQVYAFDLDRLDSADGAFLFGRARALPVEEPAVDIDQPPDLELARLLFPASPLAELEACS